MNLKEEYLEEGAVLIKNCLHNSHFTHIDAILSKEWNKFSVDNPYNDICAKFAKSHQSENDLNQFQRINDFFKG